MAWIHPVARKFASVLQDDPHIVASDPYTNEQGVPGWRYRVNWHGRDFYISESRTDDPIALDRVAHILSIASNLDERKEVLYQNNDLFPDCGLRVEAWDCGRWFQVFTPDNLSQPSDDFRQLAIKIRGADNVNTFSIMSRSRLT